MKLAANIVGGVLGFAFAALALLFLLHVFPEPKASTEDIPSVHFMKAFIPTGYMTFVKVLELVGGVLVAIPLTRNFGLLILGPIIVNIIAFHVFVEGGLAVLDPILIVISLLAAFLLWAGRGQFLGLLNRRTL